MNTKKLVLTSFMIVFVVLAQLTKINYIAGPLVNAILIYSVLQLDIQHAVLVGLISPFLAHLFGIMPLLIVVPFIAIANVALCLTFWLVKKINLYLAIVPAALLKFLVLYSVVNYFINVPKPVMAALGIVQLYTALAGGVIALLLYARTKKLMEKQ